ncbi:MAG: energy transducer TonB [Burkholderiales bacterium]|nr:energy transducer TonB [Burkholderiales bacterium]
MTEQTRRARGALWAQPDEDEARGLPFWQALLVAALIELGLPFFVFGVDWSFLGLTQPPPTPVMNVRLDPPPEVLPPPPPPEKKKPELEKIKQVEVELPPPLPNAPTPKILVAKPEPEPEKPDPEKKKEEPPEPEPEEPQEEEVEAPPMPSVFQEVKPVRKVKPKYPEDAVAQHIEGQVKVRLSVDIDGRVTNAVIMLAEPPGVFDESVLEAVRQYKFKRDGTTYEADQLVVFRLE